MFVGSASAGVIGAASRLTPTKHGVCVSLYYTQVRPVRDGWLAGAPTVLRGVVAVSTFAVMAGTLDVVGVTGILGWAVSRLAAFDAAEPSSLVS